MYVQLYNTCEFQHISQLELFAFKLEAFFIPTVNLDRTQDSVHLNFHLYLFNFNLPYIDNFPNLVLN